MTILKSLQKQLSRILQRIKNRLRIYIIIGIVGIYLYGMFVNSVIRGTTNTFHNSKLPILVWNPFENIAAVFTAQSFGIAVFIFIFYMLISKNGYYFLTGTKIIKDKRNFNIINEGTHGTSGWMSSNEMEKVLDVGSIEKINGSILGKIKKHPYDYDEFAEYIGLKENNGLNKHIMVYGASGAGKSRGFVKPFILQTAKRMESMILVDPKGEFFESMSGYLKDKGYEVRAFNLLDMENSDGWNCLHETCVDQNMVQSVAEVIIRNTSNANERQDFWEKAEMNLLMALMLYVQDMRDEHTGQLLPIEKRSLGTIYKMIATEGIMGLEKKFRMLPPDHPAKPPYGIFKQAAHQLYGNIAIGLGSRLNVFQNKLVDKITKYNEIDLELPGIKPCAYFCIISDQDSSLEFLSSLFFSLLFSRLSNYARKNGNNGRLPVEVNFLLDEFANIGKILDFKKTISTVRSRGINCQVIVQSTAQLADRYPKNEWQEIVGNCDTQLFLGCNDEMTAKFISDRCGFITIQLTNSASPQTPLFSPLTNSSKPYTQTRMNNSRPLMYPDEILRLDNKESLVLIRGEKPLRLYKVIPDEHPDFNLLRTFKIDDYIPDWHDKEDDETDTASFVEATDLEEIEEVPLEVSPTNKPQPQKSIKEALSYRKSCRLLQNKDYGEYTD